MDAAPRQRPRLQLRLLAVLCVTASASAAVADPEPSDDASAADPTVLNAGRELFARTWSPKDPRSHGGDGLGPVFNAQSCLDCHDQGGPGGAGPASRNIEVVTPVAGPSYGYSYAFAMDFGSGRFEYRFGNPAAASGRKRNAPALDRNLLATIHPGFRDSRSVVLHRFGTDVQYAAWREAVPGPRGTVVVQTAERNPTPLFGLGLIDAIPDEAIEEAARRKAPGPGAGSSRVRGRVSRSKEGRVGRFGWKAQTATLAEFVRSAAATEIGLEVPGHHQAADPRLPGIGASGLDLNEGECRALTAYVRTLRAPAGADRGAAGDAVKAGEATFRSIGCADCHLPSLADVEGIYSDLLLHDMGPRLGDTGVYGVFTAGPNPAAPGRAEAGRPDDRAPASPQEWRTPPLWGLRDSAPYLHDGRAATLEQAIALHGGQGQSSAHRFAQLSSRRKQQLEAFLKSLAPPAGDDPKPGLAQAP